MTPKEGQQWLSILEVVMTSDCDLAKWLVSNETDEMEGTFNFHDPLDLELHDSLTFRYPSEHAQTLQGAQRAHIIMQRLLCNYGIQLGVSSHESESSWLSLKELMSGRVHVPSESELCGRWAGYYTYMCNERGHLRALSFTLLPSKEVDDNISYTLTSQNESEYIGASFRTSFSLAGFVEHNGKVLLRKTTEALPLLSGRSTFYGFILPWGMAGTYEEGLFWLRKEEEELYQ